VHIVLHFYRSRTRDDGNFKESEHPRKSDGKFGSGGGVSSSVPAGGGAHAKKVHEALSAKIKGSSAERVNLRALLKDPNTPSEYRILIKHKIIESFAEHHAALIKKGDTTKAAEIAGKAAEHSKKYGVGNPLAIKTVAQANAGYAPAVQAQAQAVMKAELPKPASGQFTPQEVADFNDLVSLGSESNAKSWTASAKKKVASLGLKMSPGECAHIVAYSGSAYKKTNKELRAGVMDEATFKHANALNSALDKLPAHVGKVYRKVSVSTEISALYQPGKVFVEQGFMSTSKSSSTWAGDLQFVIHSKTGRDIEDISSHPDEKEVLFKSGTRFKITAREGNKITMEEIDGR
jgi:hypothetical protein